MVLAMPDQEPRSVGVRDTALFWSLRARLRNSEGGVLGLRQDCVVLLVFI